MSDSRHEGTFLVGVVFGAVCGAAATLWVTPMAGDEVRQQLRRWSEDAQRRTLTAAGDLQVRGQSVLARGLEVLPLFTVEEWPVQTPVNDEVLRSDEPATADQAGTAEPSPQTGVPVGQSALETHRASPDA